MFVKLFKSNHQILLSFLFVIGALIWLFSLFNPTYPPLPRDTELFYRYIYNFLIKINPEFSVLLAFILLFVQSVIFNNLVINHSLNEKNTFLPSLIYFILMSLLPQYCTFNPILISNIVILLCFNTILKIYLKEDSLEAVFNISIFISLLSLFYAPAAFYLLFVWLSFFVYRIFKWREWFISIIAFAVPYIFVTFCFFWVDNLAFMNKYLSLFNNFSFAVDYHEPRIITLIILEFFLLIAAFKYQNFTKDKIVMLRKFAGVTLAFYFVGFLSLYSSHQNWINHLMCTFLPASVFVSYWFQKIKKEWIAELIFFLFIVAIIINRYFL